MGNWEILGTSLHTLWIVVFYAWAFGWALGTFYRKFVKVEPLNIRRGLSFLNSALVAASFVSFGVKIGFVVTVFAFIALWQFLATFENRRFWPWDFFRPSFYQSENRKK